VKEVDGREKSVWTWRLRWRRVRFEWESLQEEDILRYISTGSLRRETKDLQTWGGDPTEEFSVRSAYDYLTNQGLG